MLMDLCKTYKTYQSLLWKTASYEQDLSIWKRFTPMKPWSRAAVVNASGAVSYDLPVCHVKLIFSTSQDWKHHAVLDWPPSHAIYGRGKHDIEYWVMTRQNNQTSWTSWSSITETGRNFKIYKTVSAQWCSDSADLVRVQSTLVAYSGAVLPSSSPSKALAGSESSTGHWTATIQTLGGRYWSLPETPRWLQRS